MKLVFLALVIVGLMIVAPIASADGCASCGAPRASSGYYGGGYGYYTQPVSYGYSLYDYSTPMYQTTWPRTYGVYTYDPFAHRTGWGWGSYGSGCGGGCGGCGGCGGGGCGTFYGSGYYAYGNYYR